VVRSEPTAIVIGFQGLVDQGELKECRGPPTVVGDWVVAAWPWFQLELKVGKSNSVIRSRLRKLEGNLVGWCFRDSGDLEGG